VPDGIFNRKRLLAFCALAPLMAGCSGTTEMLQSDLLSKDAQWFQRSGRLFIRSVSIETPPLSPDKPVTPDELVSADGACPGMAGSANALAAASRSGIVALWLGFMPMGLTGVSVAFVAHHSTTR
jgi:hypothetical protein